MRFDYLRKAMVENQLKDRGIKSVDILRVMNKVDRHRFVPETYRHLAYSDSPLSIGANQTISQPYIVALMLEKLEISKEHKVLEIGTGSGYQTALMAELAEQVYTIERITSLALGAQRILKSMGYNNIFFHIGDGSKGWCDCQPECSAFDRIIVAAAAPEIPFSLMNQIADGGRLIIPAGNRLSQDLIMIERLGDEFRTSTHGRCAFVPLIGEEGWKN